MRNKNLNHYNKFTIYINDFGDEWTKFNVRSAKGAGCLTMSDSNGIVIHGLMLKSLKNKCFTLSIDGKTIGQLVTGAYNNGDSYLPIEIDELQSSIVWMNGYSATSKNQPFTNIHYILITGGIETSKIQLAISCNDTHEIKTRYYINNSWSEWV